MPNKAIALLFSLFLSCTTFSDEPIVITSEEVLDLNNDVAKCYWMENYSGDYEWIPTRPTWRSSRKVAKRDCFELDSCDGGLGRSGGGCYKWATEPTGERIPWKM